MALATATRPLPGLRFEAQPPPSPVVLPRMDVAAFVGFATAGPFDLPVALEDPGEYAAIFGETEVELGWDELVGEPVTSFLGPAVRAFFANGGRRCYAIRTGRDAATTSLIAPGLVRRDGRGSFGRVELDVRSPGTWADGLSVATSLEAEPGVIARGSLRHLSYELSFTSQPARVGDLLHLATSEWSAYFTVARAEPRRDGLVRVIGNRSSLVWLDAPPAKPRPCLADVVGADGVRRDVPATYRLGAGGPELVLDLPATAAPELGGAVLVQGLGANRRVLVVESVRMPADTPGVVVGGPLRRLRRAVPVKLRDAHADTVERLVFSLWARRGDTEQHRLDGMGFAASHPRWPGRLPSDARLFDPDDAPPSVDAALWQEVRTPRYPLSGERLNRHATWIPVGMDAVPRAWARPASPPGTDQARNGVAALDERLFLDRALAGTRTEALAAQAEAIRWLAPQPRHLRGLHALFDLEEVTIAAVPDAAHRPWSWTPRESLAASTADVERSHPDTHGFRDCGLRILRAPVLSVASVDEAGRFTLTWTSTDADGATYVLAGSPDPGFAAAAEVYRGPSQQIDLSSRGASYYRVYAESGASSSDWSNAVGVDASPPGRLVSAAWTPDVLLAVQRALMRVCAARGDVVCVLGLPSHLHADDALAHRAALSAPPAVAAPFDVVPALDESERRVLSYAALYHPWPYALDGSRTPPDGAIVGTLAAAAATRGAWVAAANEPLRDVVALGPRIGRPDLHRLQDGRVNLLRQEPRGFMVLDQDTLSPDEELRPLNVRRLLCLLRRLALLHGPQYVFEPNDATLRRAVQNRFEDLLGLMFDLGAFAGATRAQGFRVSTGDPPNTRQSVDAGELIVELRVAPSRPLAFLTVRLVNGAAGLRVEGV